MSRALLRQSWCNYCRHDTIRSFLSVSGVTIPRYSLPVYPLYGSRRLFSLASRWRSENLSLENSESKNVMQETKESIGNELSSSAQNIPWYLQEEIPTAQTVSSRDQLPDLPENPPTILSPLLEYTFKDLGLDDLKLLDLRSFDIPTGLGANVIMLIATARSIKHLNVSADRLCRWMRSTWKLRPHADGLLGRNELKIKLRRKARKAKAATLAGAVYEEKDDGITTGWICVNAGVVQEDPSQPTLGDQGIEGFGNLGRGTRIAVQLFTEEKRSEVDLETLWTRRLERAERGKQKLFDENSEGSEEVRDRDPATSTASCSDYDFGHPRPLSFPFEQRRALHTSLPSFNNRVQRSQSTEAVSRNKQQFAPEDSEGRSSPGTGETMFDLLHHLSCLSDERIRSELGTGPGDSDSTLAMRLFHHRQSQLSQEDAALARIELLCIGITRGHHSYRKEALWKELKDYLLSFKLFDELGLRVFSTMLTHRPVADQPHQTSLLDSDLQLAMHVCDYLCLQGMSLLNMKIFNMLYKAATPTPDSPNIHHEILVRIPRVIEAFDVPFDSEENRIFMWSLFKNKDYDNFWKQWQNLPRNGSPRTSADYEKLFRLHAELGDARRAKQCVANWAPMMEKETPPVPKHFVIIQHIQACNALRDKEEDQMMQLQKRLVEEELDPWV
ncbi:hypothetical protein PHISCL_10061 [Aspergillus sclerotialis]|uniref:ATPase synthesis protein 25 n=1 Tax=Aspergillus sclerotialis TaxID=2070753 RepID=A0A3A2ZKB3_9EURO|nr:hypothetical protein PHISCL_10061 [Aspergillus sclerotialis]